MLFQLSDTEKPTSIYCTLPGTTTVCAKGITPPSRETTLSVFYQFPQIRNLCQVLILHQETALRTQSWLLALFVYLIWLSWFLASIPIRPVDVKQLDMDFSSEIFFAKLEQVKQGLQKYSNSPLLWWVLRGQEDGGFARVGLRLFTGKALADQTAGTLT